MFCCRRCFIRDRCTCYRDGTPKRRAHYRSPSFLFFSHIPTFIGARSTFGRLLCWPIGINAFGSVKLGSVEEVFLITYLSVHGGWNSRKRARGTRDRCMEMVSSRIPPHDATAESPRLFYIEVFFDSYHLLCTCFSVQSQGKYFGV